VQRTAVLKSRPEFLSEADLDLIHNHTMRVLAEVGVVVPVDEALSVFKRHGVRVEGQRVYLDEAGLMGVIGNAPAQFTIYARDPARNVVVGGDRPVFVPGYGAPFIMEFDGTTRPGTLQDYENLTRLADASPNMDMSGHMLVEPSDVSASLAYLFTLRASMVNSSKPFMGSVRRAQGARASLDMAGILFGDRVTLGERPAMISLINTLSPLAFSDESIQALMEHAHGRQPLLVSGSPNSGVSGPVSIAGTLAVGNAEVLTGLALTQLISPGMPVVYGGTGSAADMRTAGATNANPEAAIFIPCAAQMARYYGLPSRSGGCLTDSHLPDAQAGLESMMIMLTAVQSGIDFILHASGMLSSYLTVSYEKMMIDDEICGMLRRYDAGFGLEEEDLAFDVIANVGPGGSFLMEPHTARRCRTEFYVPRLSNRQIVSRWQDQGRLSMADAARARWPEVLAAHQVPVLDAGTVAQLDRYVEEHS
jgi:trimethylamine--corrinoid protein Co-methyltransferase